MKKPPIANRIAYYVKEDGEAASLFFAIIGHGIMIFLTHGLWLIYLLLRRKK